MGIIEVGGQEIDVQGREIIVFDSQRLNMIQNCAYKYDLTFNQNVAPLEKADALEKGSLIHDMLETYYKMRMWRSRWRKNGHHDKKKILQICTRVAEWSAIKMRLPIEEVDMNIHVFGQYMEHYWDEPHATLAVEQVGSKVMYQDEQMIIIYETKIDWIWSLPQIPIMPTDHKSAGRRGDVHDLSNQFIGYCWILNVRNLCVNKVGFQTTIKPADKFQRHNKSYPLTVIEGWVENSVWWIKQARIHELMGIWPNNYTSCDKYSGCIYTPICVASPEVRDFKKRQLFQIGPAWDVGAKL